jgi:hypothetical protein
MVLVVAVRWSSRAAASSEARRHSRYFAKPS